MDMAVMVVMVDGDMVDGIERLWLNYIMSDYQRW